MARAEVGDDVFGEDPTVLALQERVAGLLGHEAALFTPTGSMANVLAVRSLVGPGQEVLCESSAHIARAELGAHGAYTGLTMRTWTHPRGGVDLPALRRLFAPDMGPFFVATAAVSVENTHNFAGGAVAPAAQTCGRCAAGPTRSGPGSTSTAPGSGTPTSPPASRCGSTPPWPTSWPCASPRASARRWGRWSSAAPPPSPRRGCWRKRMGGGMRQVGMLAAAGLLRARPPPRAAGRRPRARAAAGGGLRRRPGRGGHQHRGRSSGRTRRRTSRRPRRPASGSQRVGPTTVRLVTHLDVTRADTERAAALLSRL